MFRSRKNIAKVLPHSMIKPVEYRKFVEVAKTIDIYWNLSELPGEG